MYVATSFPCERGEVCMDKGDLARYALFCVGLAVALVSSLILFGALYVNSLGSPVVFYESNVTLVLLEMACLALAAGNCVVAVEIYWRYLELKGMTLWEDV